MIKIILVMLLAAMSSNAMAKWVLVDENNIATTYANPSTMYKNGNFVKIWWLIDYKTAQNVGDGKPYLSMKLQYAFACNEKQSRTLAMYFFSGNMGSGKVIHSEDIEFQEWAVVPPDSVYEIVWRFACMKR